MDISPIVLAEGLQTPLTRSVEPRRVAWLCHGTHFVAVAADSGLIFTGSDPQHHNGTRGKERAVSHIGQSTKPKAVEPQRGVIPALKFNSLPPQGLVQMPQPYIITQPVPVIFQPVPVVMTFLKDHGPKPQTSDPSSPPILAPKHLQKTKADASGSLLVQKKHQSAQSQACDSPAPGNSDSGNQQQNSGIKRKRPSQLSFKNVSMAPLKQPKVKSQKVFWADLVRKAIMSSPERKLTGQEVYKWFEQHHPELITPVNHELWRAPIRQALRNKEFFNRCMIQNKSGEAWGLVSEYSIQEEHIKPVSTVSIGNKTPPQISFENTSMKPLKQPRLRRDKGFWPKLVTKAIESHPEQKSTARDVINWVEQNHPELMVPVPKRCHALIRNTLENQKNFKKSIIRPKEGNPGHTVNIYSINHGSMKSVSTAPADSQSGIPATASNFSSLEMLAMAATEVTDGRNVSET